MKPDDCPCANSWVREVSLEDFPICNAYVQNPDEFRDSYCVTCGHTKECHKKE